MRPQKVIVGAFISVVVVAIIGLVYMDHRMTEKRLQALPPPSPVPSATSMPTATPTPIPSVRVIYGIPEDTSYEYRYEQAIRDAVRGVQRWYGDQLSGHTFTVSGSLPQICIIKEQASHFHGIDGWQRVVDSVQHCDPVEAYSEWITWVIYVDVDVPCENEAAFELGAGGSGIAILHGFDIQGLVHVKEYAGCNSWPSFSYGRWEGGLAHELGHAFGLSHPPGCNASPETCEDKSLMWSGYGQYPHTFLNDDDVAYLTELLSDPSR